MLFKNHLFFSPLRKKRNKKAQEHNITDQAYVICQDELYLQTLTNHIWKEVIWKEGTVLMSDAGVRCGWLTSVHMLGSDWHPASVSQHMGELPYLTCHMKEQAY